MGVDVLHSFEGWRARARMLLAGEVSPPHVSWESSAQSGFDFAFLSSEDGSAQGISPAHNMGHNLEPNISPGYFTVPKEFVSLAKRLCIHRNNEALSLLYRLLWRITHGERALLHNPADEDVLTAQRYAKAVSRDVHKMHAFVRFRRIDDSEGERFVAFHRPDHFIVRVAAPFFVRRFGSMRWRIETPDETADWDTRQLVFSEGVPHASVKEDPVEDEWRTYYRAIANPARLKLGAMKKEMPVRHWSTMPETAEMGALLAQAATRVQRMKDESVGAAVPMGHTLAELREEAKACTACPLFAHATQTVFGRGNEHAGLVLVGEQPGDTEDVEGMPFVGPAGALLESVLGELGIDREELYLTNAVKHFKFEERGKARLHKKASGKEVLACRPWLAAELQRVQPQVVLCLGVTAAQAVLGRTVNLGRERGDTFQSAFCNRVLVTYHPAAILRAIDQNTGDELRRALADDIRRAYALAERAK